MTLPYSSTKRSQYIYLRSKGWTYPRIAKEYGVSKRTVRQAVLYDQRIRALPKLLKTTVNKYGFTRNNSNPKIQGGA